MATILLVISPEYFLEKRKQNIVKSNPNVIHPPNGLMCSKETQLGGNSSKLATLAAKSISIDGT